MPKPFHLFVSAAPLPLAGFRVHLLLGCRRAAPMGSKSQPKYGGCQDKTHPSPCLHTTR